MPSLYKDIQRLEAKVAAKEAEVAERQAAEAADAIRPAVQIDRPEWYCFPNGVMVADITDYIEDFNIGNAIKYACRAGRKPGADVMDDLHKAKWYIERRIKVLRDEAAAAQEAASPAPVPEQAAEAAEEAPSKGEDYIDGVSSSWRRFLVKHFGELHPNLRPTWHGRPVNIGGWGNGYASLNTTAPGMWGVAWRDVNDVYYGRKTFDQCNIWLVSNAWLGSEGGK